jgi:cation:H+ antiporter
VILAIIVLIIGFVLLVWSADRLIYGASELALRFGVSALTIGLTLVALGTSLPEIIVSIASALHGNPEMALGNVLGSNIANVTLVLGLTLIIVPMTVARKLIWREFPLLFFAMLLVILFMLDGYLSRFDGLVMVIVIVVILTIFLRRKTQIKTETSQQHSHVSRARALTWFVIGVIILPCSALLIVKSGVFVAHYFHVSDLMIGLTIFAIGTSLPELATCVVGARRGQSDLVMGNIIGSNVINLLVVLALPAFISPMPVRSQVFSRDLPWMVFTVFLVLTLMMLVRHKKVLGKVEGVILLLTYVAYLVLVVIQA